jgi:hypothetical protein
MPGADDAAADEGTAAMLPVPFLIWINDFFADFRSTGVCHGAALPDWSGEPEHDRTKAEAET